MLGRKGMKRKAWAEDSPTAVEKPIHSQNKRVPKRSHGRTCKFWGF